MAIELTISSIEMRPYISLLLLLTFTCSARAQSKPHASGASRDINQQPGSPSETYNDTIRMIKAWRETEENAELGRLFAIGDLRTSDLLAACRSADDEIASAAFITLQLLGKSECVPCGSAIARMHNGLAFVCGASITDADFTRIEKWLAKKQTGRGYECGEDYEPLTPLDDSVVYALILQGSPRSRLILKRMLAIEKACVAEGTTIIGEVLSQAESLIVAAKRVGHNINFEPGTLERVIRPSAFFLPSGYREDSRVEMIAHNKTGDRILLEVSYRCGLLCGSGYWVVLQKDGIGWQYAVIGMAWIS
jgi:hypothetical protein